MRLIGADNGTIVHFSVYPRAQPGKFQVIPMIFFAIFWFFLRPESALLDTNCLQKETSILSFLAKMVYSWCILYRPEIFIERVLVAR